MQGIFLGFPCIVLAQTRSLVELLERRQPIPVGEGRRRSTSRRRSGVELGPGSMRRPALATASKRGQVFVSAEPCGKRRL